MKKFIIVETDNDGRDYPYENQVNLVPMTEERCNAIAKLINEECSGDHRSRFWKVVPEDYVLEKGFQG